MARHGTRQPQQHRQQDQAPNAKTQQDNIGRGDGYGNRQPRKGGPGRPDNDGQRGPERAMQPFTHHGLGYWALGMGQHALFSHAGGVE